ncbi:hypothetical protein Aph02nite_36630 [Actinoplanes philippinensis]|uniref:Intein C-terminal splicing region/intein N-terminal splicing region/RHS repeat-associated core domain-containing protein n=1 Tax=Actinoplanes philippinensis TaxID=35752 RepID=A0A1I2FG40_9ACTN|nr:RHS repeat-associated core domain-containing protein [Actinoplanes philippinensis]GIE77713.1 hypothetical protein Aph02nite_36630 [Actinoplanes philippinensis]SFF03869.1 intein C-terminal splicing region/intein N-terminal splicing region/RHS repeat-associated core domain-containing protein [Actinoplanes philippinensis]
MTSTGPGGQRLNTYTYDKTGNTKTRQEGGATQSLEWNPDGRVAKIVDPTKGETTFVYDADGNRLLRRTTAGTTLYLPETEVTAATDGTLTADRYYTQAGAPTVIRSRTATGETLSVMLADHHNTATAAVRLSSDMTVQRRKLTPYGEDRGQKPQLWPGQRGFVGGTIDDSTGLIHLGAREYDPAIGRFLSVDPVIDVMQPLQLQPYSYAYNSPLTFTDPDGLWGWSEIVHTALDVAGMVPVIGEAADLTNAAVYAAEGNWGEAALCAAAAIPVAGNAIAAAKMGRNAKKAINAAEAIAEKADDAVDVAKAAPPVKAPDPEPPTKVADNTKRTETCATKNSFAPDTPVLMADGTTKPIGELETGEEVLAADPETGEQGPREIVATIAANVVKPVVKVTVVQEEERSATAPKPAAEDSAKLSAATATGSDVFGSLIATTEHPFWVEDLQAWVPASELLPGMWLRTSTDTWVQVGAVSAAGNRSDVRNLTINDLHTYYVLAGETPVLVHNCGNGSSKAEDHVSWVDEGGDLSLGRRGMPQGAYDYQSGVAGARSNAATRYGQAPQLEMPGADGKPVTAKFDGLEGNEIIDRKLNPRFTEKAVDQARRQAATAAYHGLTPVWELPDEAAMSAAIRFMSYAKISTIVVRQAG